MKRLLLAIDFDGTIVEHVFPKIGKPLPYAFQVMKKLQSMGHYLILNTCREDEGYKIEKQYLTQAVNFCKDHGVEFRSINQNLPEDEFRPPDAPNRKIYANMYIDDKNFGGFPGWDKVAEHFDIEIKEGDE